MVVYGVGYVYKVWCVWECAGGVTCENAWTYLAAWDGV